MFARIGAWLTKGLLFGALSNETVNGISTGLESFGSNLLDNFVQILPALAGIAAILMILGIIKKKVKA